MSVCADCRAEQDRWLHETSPLTHSRPGIRFHSHAAYDDTPAGMRENRTARWRTWRDLVVEQCAAITELCEKNHQIAPNITPLPVPEPWGQFDLFGEAS